MSTTMENDTPQGSARGAAMDPQFSQPELDALRETLQSGANPNVRELELCGDDRLLRRALPEMDEAVATTAEALRLAFTRALRGPVTLAPQRVTLMLVDEARALHYELYPLFTALFYETNPIPVKEALHVMGKIDREMRLPLCPMGKDTREKLLQVMKAAGLV